MAKSKGLLTDKKMEAALYVNNKEEIMLRNISKLEKANYQAVKTSLRFIRPHGRNRRETPVAQLRWLAGQV